MTMRMGEWVVIHIRKQQKGKDGSIKNFSKVKEEEKIDDDKKHVFGKERIDQK